MDIDSLAQQVAKYIQERDFFESRIYRNEDDGLIGLLYLCTAMIKHNPPFKFTQEGRVSTLLFMDLQERGDGLIGLL